MTPDEKRASRKIVNKKYNDSHKELYQKINAKRTKDGAHAVWHIKSRYGITPEERLERIALQNHKCAICKRDFVMDVKRHPLTPVMDHDHSCCDSVKTCGKCLRGVLCTYCNKAIGALGDDPEVLRSALDYLERYKR